MNMNAKIVIVSLAIYFIGANTLFAQRQFDANEKLKTLQQKLELNDDQYIEVEKILLDLKNNINEMVNNNSGDRYAMKTQMHDLIAKSNLKIEKLLNEEQKIIFQKIIVESKNKRRRGGR